MDWIPEIGDVVQHQSGVVFLVNRRTRVRDQNNNVIGIKLWDCASDIEGRSYPLNECSRITFELLLSSFQLSTNSGPIHVQPVHETDGTVIVSLSRGDRIMYVKIPSIEEQVAKAAISMAKFFSGTLIKEAAV